MTQNLYRFHQCQNPACRFRFPVSQPDETQHTCPRCGGPTVPAAAPFSAHKAPETEANAPGPQVEVLLDNLRSLLNVGSIFRTADGAGIRRLHLCGTTATPENTKLAKTALSAELSVAWQYWPSGLEAAATLKNQGMRLWALEGGSEAQSLFAAWEQIPQEPVLLVVGNEVAGVDPAILELCERRLWIPMTGYKRSLNVAVAFGIAAYALRYALAPQDL
jgi:23S rRNA (guanosine2251-2'-O)-methyltransferase